MDKMKNEGAQTPREVEDGVPRMEFQKESEAERREDKMCLDSVGVPGEHSEQPPQEAPRDSEMAVDRPETAAEGQSSEPRASQDQRDDSSAPTHQGEEGAVHNQSTSSEADVPHSPQVTSPAAVHAGDDGVEVEHIEEASVSQPSSMDVDEEEDLPEPPIKIKVEPADPEILASVAPEVNVEEPAGTEEAVVSSAGDESRPSAIEKDVPKDGGMEVDGDTHRVEDVPAASDLSKSDPSLEEPLTGGKDGMMEIDGQHSSQDESEATVQPAEPDTLPHAHQPVVQEPPEPPTTTAAEEVSSPLSEPETEAPRTPPPPPQVQVQGEQQKAQPLYNADERTMDEFVML
ncbi:hypothetical protein GLOTRDRAFT_111047 [Gloeophyllum trabeum ATCC 11539]|uniref:Uncharacterized protein n=1 Tax=Gloeophyllum trabeum (strain ATCC 11539 / FP-39264 / Madison 617) TaxID=670483 RepID=S7RN72_GLOTA|nr:uncharacterized protein GLOTRDRAFT_111047 [Gloeophyllum trabeum ATCC 11539]EPQ55910.1 hypothetical protein GLOTRDRAFT_111047 [Gloeophyllum trabeum ATCC 11539]